MRRNNNQYLLLTFFFCVVFIFFIKNEVLSQKKALSSRIANYDIDVFLDIDDKKLKSQQTIYFKNPSKDTIRDLQFHLYYNAFKNSESTFFKERNSLANLLEDGVCPWGWSEVKSIKDQFGNNLSSGMQYIQNDDGNHSDQTVLRVKLTTPILPNQTVQYQLEWEARIPKTMPRTGYNKDFYFFAQWFPKLGVYETKGMRYAQKGQWNCHQYHSNGEYYADFGVYNVNITAPKNFVLGASGQLVNKKEDTNTNTWSFHVEDVIDFAWAASPHFIIKKDKWKDVEIQLLTYDSHSECANRYFKTMKNAFEFLDQHLGKYPYPTLTIINPPIHGIFTGGMEYPTLITSIDVCLLPDELKTSETLTTHEFIHQYFMQMVATNEQEEPWMDEGLTTYFEGRILDKYEGENTSFVDWQGIKIGNSAYNRVEFLSIDNPKIAPNTFMSREFIHGGYGKISYNKTAVWLKTLEGLIGIETMDEIMKTYFERWKFKHPSGQDFIDVANEIVLKNHGGQFGENMDWFFDQVLKGTEMCDYAVASISNRHNKPKTGFFEDLEKCKTNESDNLSYTSKVILHRLGEIKLPVDVQINFDDGSSTLEHWDGQARSKDFTYIGQKQIISAEIDPERKIYLDKNFINNSYIKEPPKKGTLYYVTKFMTSVQHFMQTLSMLV